MITPYEIITLGIIPPGLPDFWRPNTSCLSPTDCQMQERVCSLQITTLMKCNRRWFRSGAILWTLRVRACVCAKGGRFDYTIIMKSSLAYLNIPYFTVKIHRNVDRPIYRNDRHNIRMYVLWRHRRTDRQNWRTTYRAFHQRWVWSGARLLISSLDSQRRRVS